MNMQLKEGTPLQGGKYRIGQALGQGSFGITYLANAKYYTEGNLGRMEMKVMVAIKEFFMSDINSRSEGSTHVEGSSGSVFTNYRRKFRKEAENLAKLSHNNIVRVFDVFDENGTTYYAMEYIDGKNLDDYILSRGRLPEDEAVGIIREVGKALDYMHSRKMLHLDIKPKNVMHDSGNNVRLIDFGLAKQFTDSGEPETSTTIGLGTPGYAPLEQSSFRQDGSFPATLDVYALGATLFKMLTGKRPPEATTVLNDGFPDRALHDAGVSLKTAKAVEKAMSPFKKNRFQSVGAFMDALSHVPKTDRTSYAGYEDTVPPPRPRPNPRPNPTPTPDYTDTSGSTVTPTPGKALTIMEAFRKRNMLTNVALLLGFLYYGYTSITPGVWDDLTLPIVLACFIFNIRLLLNKGSWKLFPVVMTVFCVAVMGLDRLMYMFWNSLHVLPYLGMLALLFLKKDGVNGYQLFGSHPFSMASVKKVIRGRNIIANIILGGGVVLMTFIGLWFLASLLANVNDMVGLQKDVYTWNEYNASLFGIYVSLYMVLCMIGMWLLFGGYNVGNWILWYAAILLFVEVRMIYPTEPAALAFVPVFLVQLVLFIPKKGLMAWQVPERQMVFR